MSDHPGSHLLMGGTDADVDRTGFVDVCAPSMIRWRGFGAVTQAAYRDFT